MRTLKRTDYNKDSCNTWLRFNILLSVVVETQKPIAAPRYTTITIGWGVWSLEITL